MPLSLLISAAACSTFRADLRPFKHDLISFAPSAYEKGTINPVSQMKLRKEIWVGAGHIVRNWWHLASNPNIWTQNPWCFCHAILTRVVFFDLWAGETCDSWPRSRTQLTYSQNRLSHFWSSWDPVWFFSPFIMALCPWPDQISLLLKLFLPSGLTA